MLPLAPAAVPPPPVVLRLRRLAVAAALPLGKVHGSLARAGKVRGQTPKVAKQDKKKKPRGRAHKRMQYNRRFVTAGLMGPLQVELSGILGRRTSSPQVNVPVTSSPWVLSKMAGMSKYLGLSVEGHEEDFRRLLQSLERVGGGSEVKLPQGGLQDPLGGPLRS
ncbi:hypothetical protein HHK36_025546 [Tetracentron sinense]|uniref:40S ribosomal protein S30 n=1 Tax=Tetracentron sinense TaxID=13715 RepID=A0A834YIX3_TETSI|nr:hypothetical protein HHK36_025546 [Tetracentron sinense]